VSPVWLLPFLFWFASLALLVWVFVPRRYETREGAPETWKEAFVRAGDYKFRLLSAGAACFALGLLAAVAPLVFGL
jgi:hypothetical protein